MIVISRTVSVSIVRAFITPSTRDSGSASGRATGSTRISSASARDRTLAINLSRLPSRAACCTAPDVIPSMPRQTTWSSATVRPKATAARIRALATTSWPSTSSLGSGSA
jgi:hypothetical protein